MRFGKPEDYAALKWEKDMNRRTFATMFASSAAIVLLAVGPSHAEVKVGAPAPVFSAVNSDGKTVNLNDYRGKTVVLEWTNDGCPYVRKHYGSGNMQALQKKYGNEVVWLMVNSTAKSAADYEDPAKISGQLKQFGAHPAAYVMDEAGRIGAAYGAKVTPHMYIIDASGKVAYNGAIDDKRSTNPEDVKTSKNYVAAALDELKAGKPVSVATTAPYGCTVKYR